MRWPWVARERLDAAERRAQIAEDRLYAAWKEGAHIPPRQAVEPHEPEVIRLLPEKLHEYVNNWENPETRADLEREARKLLELGYQEDRVLDIWAGASATNGITPRSKSE